VRRARRVSIADRRQNSEWKGAPVKQIIEKAWLVPLGFVNGVLLEGDDGGLVLIDAGFPGHEAAIFDALATLGRRPQDLRHLVFTHAHPDHVGSAAAVIKRTGAETWMHPTDVPIAASGGPFRPMTPSPRLPQRIGYRVFWRPNESVMPVHVDHEIDDGEVLPVAGGLEVLHTPGHSAGHVSMMWQGGRLLIVGDVGSNVAGVSDPLGFEDPELGRHSQRRLASLNFQAAAFGHGRAIPHDAAARVRRAWGPPR
jgi:glyoxylase-like metal-dependent hydrolase (beta-lactamase superfamily II)